MKRMAAASLMALATLFGMGAGPAAQGAEALIFNAWWAAADKDQDGCVAPETPSSGIRLYWDADVLSVNTLLVYERIYSRPSASSAWELLATNAPHAITANSPADAQYVELAPASGCAARDYKIELLLASTDVLQNVRDSSNDQDLSQHKEEGYDEDLPSAKIYDASWSRVADRDLDGCVAPLTEQGGIRLQWDADVAATSSLNVFERVYSRPAAGGKWALVAATQPHVITGNSTADAQFMDIVPTNNCQTLEYKIELYRVGNDVPDYVRDGTNDPDLANVKQESYVSDTGPVIADAWWSHVVDASGDGCFAPDSASGLMRLHWDANVAGGGSLAVIERIYYRTTGTNNWTLAHTSARHTITGSLTTDAQYADLAPATNCEARDYKIELLRADTEEVSHTLDGARDPDLAAHKEQSYAQDNAAAIIANAWWTNVADRDNDGCHAPATSSAYFQLSWNPDAANGATLTVYEKVWWRDAGLGGQNWTLAVITQPHVINGTSTNDVQSVNLSPGTGCAAYDYMIEIFRAGREVADDALTPSEDADLANSREETWSEDNLLATVQSVWWSNIADADADTCLAPETNGTPVLNWNPDVANGATLSVFEKVFRRANGTQNWNIFYITNPHEIGGIATDDAQSVSVPEEIACAPMDYRIEIYRVNQVLPDAFADPSNQSILGNRKQESSEQDAPRPVITSVVWMNERDQDGDGCLASRTAASPLLMSWNVDLTAAGSAQVYERIYWREAGESSWTLLATNDLHDVQSPGTNDAQTIRLHPASCSTREFRIEVYQGASLTPAYAIGPDDLPNALRQRLESYTEDNLVPFIADAFWSNLADHDNDGCMAPGNRTNMARLNWNADVSGSATMLVFEKIYSRPVDSTNWVLLQTNAPHAITAASTADAQFADIPVTGGCLPTDYMIEIYRAGAQTPDSLIGPGSDANLANVRLELYGEDNTLARINNTWWSSYQDTDADGCVAPTNANSGLRLHWDADVAGLGDLTVFERVYRRAGANGAWVLLFESAPHRITGTMTTDAQSLVVPVAESCGPVDYRIEIYRAGSTEPDFVRDYTNDSVLSQHSEESYGGDTQVARGIIGRVWWSNRVDNDGDGCVAPAQLNGYIRLNWDVDAPEGAIIQAYEKVYWRSASTNAWVAIFTSLPHTISGTNAENSEFVDLLPGTGCSLSEYRIELFRVGAVLPDHVREPANDPLLSAREESYVEDPGVTPLFTLEPQGQTVSPGGSVTLRIQTTGTQPISHQWYKGATLLTGQTNDNLVLLKVQATDAGDYTVLATNPIGNRTSRIATVAIRSATRPKIEAPAIAEDGHFQFRITGDPGSVAQVEFSTTLESWKLLTAVTNQTGTATFKDTTAIGERRFYRVAQP